MHFDRGKTNALSQDIIGAKDKSKSGVKQEPNKKGFMKKGRRRANMAAQEMENVVGQGMSYSEISARLRDVEQAQHQMSRGPNDVQKSSFITLGRNQNAVAQGIPGPFLNEGKQDKRAEEYRLVNLLRMVEIPAARSHQKRTSFGKTVGTQ